MTVTAGAHVSDSDNVLPYPDQAMFLALREAGQEAVMQVLWIYEHPLDMEGLNRFHHNFGRGILARRIETSPLPFGRHRWVDAGPPPDLGIAARPRDPSELYDWADEQVDLPLDPEWGPGWRLSVQPLADGTTVVSLVVSHCIADGGAVVMALVQAVRGVQSDLGYPQPGSRSRLRTVAADLRQIVRDAPETARTLRKAVKVLAARRKELARPGSVPATLSSPGSRFERLPTASVFTDVAEWDIRAKDLGGNSFSLVAAFAARVAELLGRTRRSDGKVTLIIPVNDRDDFADAGGNVVALANASFDPAGVTADLSGPRSAIRDALKTAREVPDEMIELLPLIPFLPKRAIGRMADAAFGFSTDLPVSCSNMGDLPPELNRVDGTDAEYLSFRGVDRRVSRDTLERRHGLLTVASGRVAGRIVNTVISYQPGADNSPGRLREVIQQALGEFELSGRIL